MNFARLNMSHGSMVSHQSNIDLIRQVEQKLNKKIPIILDTKGPELRVKKFQNQSVILQKNQRFILTAREVVGNEQQVTLAQPYVVQRVKVGDVILANNGMLQLLVESHSADDIFCRVLFGGVLSDNKGITLPAYTPEGPYLSDNDKRDLTLAINNEVEYVAASFVYNANCVKELKDFLKSHRNDHIKIIAKIENQEGINNIDEIIAMSDGLMIARGDLGVELPQERVPALQKMIVKKCNQANKFCIVATEMLETMTTNIRPTRAEVSDVANAVYDGANAVMLSGETAVGKHPALVVETMRKIVLEAEKTK